MKKIKMFLVAVVLLFTIAAINFSCGNKDKATTTTYQIINNMPLVPNQGGDVLLDNSIYEVWVDCYVGSAIVRTDKFDKIAPAGGTTAKTEVDKTFDKIKISCKVLPSNDPILSQYNIADPRIYLTGFTTLKENTNNVVTITYDTPIDGKGNGLTVGTSITTIVKK